MGRACFIATTGVNLAKTLIERCVSTRGTHSSSNVSLFNAECYVPAVPESFVLIKLHFVFFFSSTVRTFLKHFFVCTLRIAHKATQ